MAVGVGLAEGRGSRTGHAARSGARPAPGSWSLAHKGGHRGSFAISFSVAPDRHGIKFAFFEARLRCLRGTSGAGTTGAWYGFVSDAFTKEPAVPIRKGRFHLKDKVPAPDGSGIEYVDIRGHFTGRRRASGRVSMDLSMTDGRICSIAEFRPAGGKFWKATRIADPRIKAEPPAVKPGGAIIVSGRGMLKRTAVTLYVPGRIARGPKIFRLRANRDGRFRRRVRVGGSLPDGTYRVIASQLIVPDFVDAGYYFWGAWSARVRGQDNIVITKSGPVG